MGPAAGHPGPYGPWLDREQTGRKAYLMEMDSLYCDVIVARFEQFTGQKAERAHGAVETTV